MSEEWLKSMAPVVMTVIVAFFVGALVFGAFL